MKQQIDESKHGGGLIKINKKYTCFFLSFVKERKKKMMDQPRPRRKYKGHPDGRCSTFEAVVALLRTLGHPRGECEALLDNVRTTVDAVLVQKSMPSARI